MLTQLSYAHLRQNRSASALIISFLAMLGKSHSCQIENAFGLVSLHRSRRGFRPMSSIGDIGFSLRHEKGNEQEALTAQGKNELFSVLPT